jgi:hypothetical protein
MNPQGDAWTISNELTKDQNSAKLNTIEDRMEKF